MERKSKVYLQMLVSCLSILVIPMLLAMVIYGYTLRIIRNQTEEMNKSLLVMVQKEFDYELENIKKLLYVWLWTTDCRYSLM